MGLAAATLDIVKVGLINVIDFERFRADAYERHRVQYRLRMKTVKMQFDGELFLHNSLPRLAGRLTVWPYIGEDLAARHFDVTATVTKDINKTKEISEGPNKGTWDCFKTWFSFNFVEVFNVKEPPYAKVIEMDDEDDE